MFSIHDEPELKSLLDSHGEKPFRYKQIENAIYKHTISDFADISTISLSARALLSEHCFVTSLRIRSTYESDSGQTTRMLMETVDGLLIEAVIMRHLSGRNTLCVSSQAGCPMGCAFCATGTLGLQRNLEFYEIVDQIFLAERHISTEGRHLRNIVFMGMGEPFLNSETVKRTIEICCQKEKFDFSNRRITVSTCGIVPGIRRFMVDFPQTSLAISLHAPTDELRARIMPVSATYPLTDLMSALRDYEETTRNRVFFEYIMIEGVTDRIEHAHALAALLRGRLAHVNLIPYNVGEGGGPHGFRPSGVLMVAKFQKTLQDNGITVTLRHTMGDDIDAACGQLALSQTPA